MRLGFLIFLLSCLSNCSSPEVTGKTEAEKLYKEAKNLVSNGRYLLATEKLNIIRTKYSYSYYAVFAELMGADVLYSQENYSEAAEAYILFKDFHPRHEKIPYVISRIGESFYKQVPSTYDRDLSSADQAIKYYSHLIRSYPKSEFIGNAREKINKCKKMIRDKEQYIADFYFKTNVFDAARFRYQNILKNYIESVLIDHSIMRSIRASIELGDPDFCRDHRVHYSSRVSKANKEDFEENIKECLKVSKTKKDDTIEKL